MRKLLSILITAMIIDDYTNPEAFADAISFVLSNEQKASSMARAGRAFVESNFGFEHVAKRLEDLYVASMKRKK